MQLKELNALEEKKVTKTNEEAGVIYTRTNPFFIEMRWTYRTTSHVKNKLSSALYYPNRYNQIFPIIFLPKTVTSQAVV